MKSLPLFILPCMVMLISVSGFGATIYVDDDAPGDPLAQNPAISDPLEDGSLLHPFDAIQEAVYAAYVEDTILIRNGLYTGTGNYNIQVNMPVHFQGEGGPDHCIIDCRMQGGGLFLAVGYWKPVVVEGLRVTHAINAGGIRVLGNAIIRNCQVQENQASGIRCLDASLSIQDCVIENNYTLNCGGGIYCENGSRLDLENCMIRNNHAVSEGGGVYAGTDSTVSMVNCTVQGNLGNHGGGLWLSSGRFDYCRIQYNQSEGIGGGIRAEQFVTLRHCLLTGNQAQTGGAVYVSGANSSFADLQFCTLANNYAHGGGGGFFGSGRIANSILWGNMAGQGQQLAVMRLCIADGSVLDTDPVLLVQSDAKYVPRNIITADPLFEADYRLGAGSPCIDAGATEDVRTPTETDLAGQVRVLDGDGSGEAAVDLGCFEYAPAGKAVIRANPDRPTFTCLHGDPRQQAQTIRILNGGDGLLNWTIEENGDWLEADAWAGTADAGGTEVTLSIDAAGLAPDVYTCDLRIGDPNAVNPERLVTVVLYVVPPQGFWVPWHYPTIKEAVDAAPPGETVVVAEGCYMGSGNRGIPIHKPLTVTCPTGPAYCVLDGTGMTTAEPFMAFFEIGTTTPPVVIDGLTLTNLRSVSAPARGIRCMMSNAVIENCVFRRNGFPLARGGGLYVQDGNPTVRDCRFEGNLAGSGAAIAYMGAWYQPMRIERCAFRGNVAMESSYPESGGAVTAYEGTSLIIEDSAFDWNYASQCGGGVAKAQGGSLTVRGCAFNRNTAYNNGGGIFIQSETVFLADRCAFRENSTFCPENTSPFQGWSGGGVCCVGLGNKTIQNSAFRGNRSVYGGGLAGTGVLLDRVEFLENTAAEHGGGVFIQGSQWNYEEDSEVKHCRIEGNEAREGGGICSLNSNLRIDHTLIAGNQAFQWGGGVSFSGFEGTDDCTVTHCVLYANRATASVSPAVGGMFLNGVGSLRNSILWNNRTLLPVSQPGDLFAKQFQPLNIPFPPSLVIDFLYCDIQGISEVVAQLQARPFGACEGNLDADPLFTATGAWDDAGTPEDGSDDTWIAGDCHLQSEAGRWDPAASRWVTAAAASPCIDAGDPADDGWTAELWPHGKRINLGIFGGTAEASLSVSLSGSPADLNHDGEVDFADWSLWAGDWRVEAVLLDTDFNRNQVVDLDDLTVFASCWLWTEE